MAGMMLLQRLASVMILPSLMSCLAVSGILQKLKKSKHHSEAIFLSMTPRHTPFRYQVQINSAHKLVHGAERLAVCYVKV